MWDRLRVVWPERLLPPAASATAPAPAATLRIALRSLLFVSRTRRLRRPLRLRRAFAVPALLVARIAGAGPVLALAPFTVAMPVPIPVTVAITISVAIPPRAAIAAMRSPASVIVAVVAPVTAAVPILPPRRTG